MYRRASLPSQCNKSPSRIGTATTISVWFTIHLIRGEREREPLRQFRGALSSPKWGTLAARSQPPLAQSSAPWNHLGGGYEWEENPKFGFAKQQWGRKERLYYWVGHLQEELGEESISLSAFHRNYNPHRMWGKCCHACGWAGSKREPHLKGTGMSWGWDGFTAAKQTPQGWGLHPSAHCLHMCCCFSDVKGLLVLLGTRGNKAKIQTQKKRFHPCQTCVGCHCQAESHKATLRKH